MGRLSLVLADRDKDYLAKFEKFLMINYPQRFELFSFSSFNKLSEFLNIPDKRDILLINSNLYNKELQMKDIEAVVFLSGDNAEHTPEGFETINKYRHAEMLITDVLRIYAARSPRAYAVSGNANTRFVGVYSPAGGTGKSCIAAGCSILCARSGLKTFYLNLEEVPSTSLFFYSEAEQSFSNVIYHLKGKGKNLCLKLEGAKCRDMKTGVHFFSPPDSILEMDELSDQDVVLLLNELKASATYDTIFIDMSCGLNQRNAAILNLVDVIILIFVPGDISIIKMKELKAGFNMLEHKYGMKLANRTVTILNRQNKKGSDSSKTAFSNNSPVIEIGEYISQETSGHASNLTENVAFLSTLNKLLECVLPQGVPAHNGGEFNA